MASPVFPVSTGSSTQLMPGPQAFIALQLCSMSDESKETNESPLHELLPAQTAVVST